jgi:hypothetical protein
MEEKSSRRKRRAEKEDGKLRIPHKGVGLMFLQVIGGVFLVFGVMLILVGLIVQRLVALAALGVMLLMLGGIAVGGYFALRWRKSHLEFDQVGMSLRVGEEEVHGEVPFDNVASAELGDRVEYYYDNRGHQYEKRTTVLKIFLVKRHCRDTHWPSMVDDEAHDIELVDEFVKPLSYIRARLLDGVNAYREWKGSRDAR